MPNPISPWFMLFVKAVTAAITFAATVMTLLTVGPAIESTFFPVVSKLQIDSIAETDQGESVLYVRFNKMRNCEYVGIAWFRGHRASSFDRVPITLGRPSGDQSSPNRPTGPQRSGPWTIGITNDQLRTNSFALLYHRCHGLWIVTTDFYP